MTRARDDHDAQARLAAGLAYGLGAYLWWGLIVTTYFHLLRQASGLELLAQRVIFGLPVLLALLAWRGALSELTALVRSRKAMITLVFTSALITANWYTFVYSVINGKLLDASLGYYINPLVSVALGMIFLGERLRRTQWVAVGIAAFAISALTISTGKLPWIALVVSSTFGSYGLLRKRTRAGPAAGLAMEMAILLPFYSAMWIWLFAENKALFGVGDWQVTGLMLLGGVVTVVPLVWFTACARRLTLATTGLLQYITPTLQFMMGLVFGEVFDEARAWTFAAIWFALAIYATDSVRHSRKNGRASLAWPSSPTSPSGRPPD